MWINRIPYQTSDDLDVVHRGEVLPPLRNHKLDHNIAARLFHCYRLTLSLPAVMGQLARLPDHLEAVAICRLAAFNRDLFDSSGDKANFIDNLRLLELNCQLLREHAGRQPIWVIVSIKIQISQNIFENWKQLTRERLLGRISRQSSWRKKSPLLFSTKFKFNFKL